jgi:hypothetical protein
LSAAAPCSVSGTAIDGARVEVGCGEDKGGLAGGDKLFFGRHFFVEQFDEIGPIDRYPCRPRSSEVPGPFLVFADPGKTPVRQAHAVRLGNALVEG